ncbi:MAG: hypothetical protein ACOYI9_12155 [Candidatus Hydrogenedentales bacterium]|jgi:hypothetical protein
MGLAWFIKRRKALLWLAAIVIWAGVSIYAASFHHHEPGESCQELNCPFFYVLLNIAAFCWVLVGILLPELSRLPIRFFTTLSSLMQAFVIPARGPPHTPFA